MSRRNLGKSWLRDYSAPVEPKKTTFKPNRRRSSDSFQGHAGRTLGTQIGSEDLDTFQSVACTPKLLTEADA